MMPKFKDDEFRESVRNILRDYGAEYLAIAEILLQEILKRINRGESVSHAVSGALAETDFFTGNNKAIVDAIYLSACAGYGVLPTLVTESAQSAIKKKLLSDSWISDKMPLSTRLHGANALMRQNIIDTISGSMRKTESVKEMAMNLYDGYNSKQEVLHKATLPKYMKTLRDAALSAAMGNKKMTKSLEEAISSAEYNTKKLNSRELKASYQAIVDAAKKFQAEAISKAARVAVEEKTRYYAERIARTESARAWFDGFLAENQDDDEVWGYRWVLSSRHSRVPFDQCDVCANMNVGFGKGVYPKNKVPSIPRHPHCMCMLEVVYEWEIDKTTKFNPNGAREYIDTLDDNHKVMLFGVEGAKAYQDGSKDWQQLLRGWSGFTEPKSRLSKADFHLQLFENDGKIKEIRGRILSDDQPKTISKGNQDKHIQGTNNFKQKTNALQEQGMYGPSRITLNPVEIQMIVDIFAGAGEIRTDKNGNWNHNETIYTNDKIVGVVVNNLTGEEIETAAFKIHYGKQGVHIVPHYPRKEH